MTRRAITTAILCALCLGLGYYAGVIVTKREVIEHFGPMPTQQDGCLPAKCLRWRSA